MFTRNCPKCGKQVVHTNKWNAKKAEKAKTICRSCSSKDITKKPDYYLKHKSFIDRYCNSENNAGEKNPFFGKKHKKDSIEKMKIKDQTTYKSAEFKDKMSKLNKGEKNPMFGRKFYDIWVQKYGKQEADRRFEQKRLNNKMSSSGENNPMYGKPSPQGAGNGWSGWYKGWFFRSLKELSYVLFLDEKKVPWKSAETISIPYIDWKGNQRTYCPDFIVGNKIIEVKPIKLKSSPTVKAKAEAATKYCDEKGYIYEIVDCDVISTEYIAELYRNGTIKFTKRYEQLYQERWKCPTPLVNG